MKTLKIFGFVLLICAGVFMIVYGGADDSPGAQGLGLLGVLAGGWLIFRLLRKDQ